MIIVSGTLRAVCLETVVSEACLLNLHVWSWDGFSEAGIAWKFQRQELHGKAPHGEDYLHLKSK